VERSDTRGYRLTKIRTPAGPAGACRGALPGCGSALHNEKCLWEMSRGFHELRGFEARKTVKKPANLCNPRNLRLCPVPLGKAGADLSGGTVYPGWLATLAHRRATFLARLRRARAVTDRPYRLGCGTVGALYERPLVNLRQSRGKWSKITRSLRKLPVMVYSRPMLSGTHVHFVTTDQRSLAGV
jgi:hypothetical protein